MYRECTGEQRTVQGYNDSYSDDAVHRQRQPQVQSKPKEQ